MEALVHAAGSVLELLTALVSSISPASGSISSTRVLVDKVMAVTAPVIDSSCRRSTSRISALTVDSCAARRVRVVCSVLLARSSSAAGKRRDEPGVSMTTPAP